jgi:tRNA pseudouridine38-40 synthase
MRNIKLIIEFDGTNYCGWQIQPNGLAIQEVIENGIEKLVGSHCRLNSSGRTDSGVHAFNLVANFMTDSRIPPDKFSYALNSVLPMDIRIKNSIEVDMDFHSRYNAKGKKYKYVIYNSEFPSALYGNRTCHIKFKLDIDQMNKAAKYFVGTHDFRAFTSTGTDVKSFDRTIHMLDVFKDKEFINIEISGNGFLYNMVRIISGTLIDVGKGIISPYDIKSIIDLKDRRRAGKTMPPQGLYLVEVYY